MATPTNKQIAKPLIYCRRSIIAWQQNAKTQTRRLINAHPLERLVILRRVEGIWFGGQAPGDALFELSHQPYAVGQLLWIREALKRGPKVEVLYAADSMLAGKYDIPTIWHWQYAKLSAMFMPRWACRYHARVLSVRSERLQDINDADALAEGVLVGNKSMTRYRGQYHGWYISWWDSLHKKPGTWSEYNPWVWVYGLERADASADH